MIFEVVITNEKLSKKGEDNVKSLIVNADSVNHLVTLLSTKKPDWKIDNFSQINIDDLLIIDKKATNIIEISCRFKGEPRGLIRDFYALSDSIEDVIKNKDVRSEFEIIKGSFFYREIEYID